MPILSKAARVAPRAAILSIVLAAPVLAETAQERAACTPDVMRLCASDIPDADRIAGCLRRQQTLLSAACRTVMSASPGADDVAATGSVRRRAAP